MYTCMCLAVALWLAVAVALAVSLWLAVWLVVAADRAGQSRFRFVCFFNVRVRALKKCSDLLRLRSI